jgi:dTDP-4-amino-4,6-dideoxygalactose transaminase
MTWPNYSPATRKAVNDLLKQGGSLSAYRANKDYGVEPVKDSYAWRFEREIERKFKVKHAVAVNSGTAALHAGLSALKSTFGHNSGEIVTSPYSFSATVSAIILAGYTPVFADVDPYTFCITKETVKRVITKRTRAIVPVSLFGGMADVRGMRCFGLPVVEDACQAVGAHSSGNYSGTNGLAGAYSFNGGKNIPAGEAGAVVTNSSEVAHQARLLMNHAENFGVDQIGLNYRPNELTCCVAYHGLLELGERNFRRNQLAYILTEKLQDSDIYRLPRLMQCSDDTVEHVWYVYPFQVKPGTREGFCMRLRKRGVPVGEGYITPALHQYKAFRKYARGHLPVVEELSSKTLCILSTLTPDRPLSYAAEVAKAMRESLCE